jgi:hypothetical protein
LTGSRLRWPGGKQVHIPLRRPQQRQKRTAELTFQAPAGIGHPPKSQATIPSQAGTSCKAGASTARSRDGQPSPSGIRGQRSLAEAESTSVKTGGPSTPHASPSPVGHQPSRTAAFKAQTTPARVRLLSRAGPTSLSQSQGPSPIRQPLTHDRPHPPAAAPQIDTLGVLCTL